MRVSYQTLTLLARAGDEQAICMLQEWERVENPHHGEVEIYLPLNGVYMLHVPAKQRDTWPGLQPADREEA